MSTRRKNLGLLVVLMGLGLVNHTLILKEQEKANEDEGRQYIPCKVVVAPLTEFIPAEERREEDIQYHNTWEDSASGLTKF